ncbi:hypothetical protein BJF90_30225 [Pseudonocardia sp. CNS-004]|nr:hypothetical protein BJF90_30225 [Pseudonocardia sp. CNS-004]
MLPTGRRATRPVAGRVATAVLLPGVLLTACTLTTTNPGPSAPAPTGPPPTSATAPTAGAVPLPWPAADAAAAAALQAEVDRGAQPWLLDPSEVAIAYAAAAHDWPDAEPTRVRTAPVWTSATPTASASPSASNSPAAGAATGSGS